jgi:hypothetical protein
MHRGQTKPEGRNAPTTHEPGSIAGLAHGGFRCRIFSLSVQE